MSDDTKTVFTLRAQGKLVKRRYAKLPVYIRRSGEQGTAIAEVDNMQIFDANSAS